ncbi:toll-like receptor 21 [Triplophysa rosa]|uniref:Toll-like receptor 21 n=1 Tax=Triplophysa rosa TaxID=992332 RepID=A0A977P1J1_TRIRA|nr:toll-like receptor 21 [Triplophysa rosa]KAI7806435.1 toll-like receptor 21 [Triplophysa rosa]UWV86663.1 Toll-like receptor 21 [Triplophysa rosa]
MANSPCREFIIKATFTCLIKFAFSYSFRNCMQVPDNSHTTYRCIKPHEPDITLIVRDLLSTATNLTVSLGSFEKIPEQAFQHLPNLSSLVLNNNQLGNIDKGAFINLTELKTLNLSCNNLSSLHRDVFGDVYNIRELLLGSNKLTDIDSLLFSNLTNLKTLDLRRNRLNHFSALVESITHLPSLTKLDLSFNHLTTLHHSAPLPQSLATLYVGNNKLHTLGCDAAFLMYVKVLDFSNNTLLSFQDFQGLNLGNITYLRLRFTKVSIIKLLNYTNVRPWHVDFSGLKLKDDQALHSLCYLLRSQSHQKKQIPKLICQDNSIKSIKNNTLNLCPSITGVLDLSRNEIKEAGCLEFLNGQNKLKSLRIEHNHLTKLFSCREAKEKFYSLRNVSFRYNRILEVNGFAFSHTPRLTNLQLNINIIAYMDHKALSGLRDLVTLRLDNNLLTDVYEDSFEDLISLKTLNLRNNQLAVIFNDAFKSLKKLTILDLGGNKIAQLKLHAFTGLDSLTKLYLDRNRLKKIDGTLFGKLNGTLLVLDLQENQIQYYTEHTHSPFINLTKLLDLKLDAQVPNGINLLPRAFFRGLTSLKQLYLTNNHITGFGAETFDDLENLEFLTLDNSCVGIAQLKPGIFKNLKKLTTLYAENMGIKFFSKEVFGNLTGLKVLHLNRNAMLTLDIGLLEKLIHLTYIDLRSCPLSCGCQNTELQNWTISNQRLQFPYLYNIICQDHTGSYFHNFDTNVCYLDLGLYLFSSTYAFTILLTVIPLLYVRLYWKFKYGYYVFRSWFGEQWRRLRDQEEKYKFDAFVSYNSADENWVMEQLLPNLEGSSFRLCLHHRDFELGWDIVDNIVAAVYGSRKTICVVSQSFLRSEWCSLEIQLASYRLFQEMQDVLLLVFLEPISERQVSAYHRMRKVMLKKTYLQWPGGNCSDPTSAKELFWSQLKRALRSSNTAGQEEQKLKEDNDQRRQEKTGVGVEEREYFLNQTPTDDAIYYQMP